MTRPREVAHGASVFPARTPTLLPATHTNSYALGLEEVVLVEPATPYDDERAAWLDWARGVGKDGRRVVAIVLTHHHVDHVGGAAFFAAELGLPLWAHPETARLLPELTFARTLDEGDVIDLGRGARYRVLFTPGHAAGHVCLFEETEGTVVVGDMVASVGTILIAPGEGDMARYLDELRRLEALGAKVALPAHGDPIEDPSTLFRRYVAHRLGREEKVRAALGEDPRSLDELVPTAYADTPPAVWPIARLSLEAHLEKLVRDGAVAKDPLGWRIVTG